MSMRAVDHWREEGLPEFHSCHAGRRANRAQITDFRKFDRLLAHHQMVYLQHQHSLA